MNYGWITTRALVCLGIALMILVLPARAQQDAVDDAALAEEAEVAPDEDPPVAFEEAAPAEELEPTPVEAPPPAPTPSRSGSPGPPE
ncbi:MAG TPA: hypothetical protein PLD73_14405, partial [Candidatus Hydrogenedentes bacterium]|nr:hypothetical protein [Candidatus Hydrogenedentota bacterium]